MYNERLRAHLVASNTSFWNAHHGVITVVRQTRDNNLQRQNSLPQSKSLKKNTQVLGNPQNERVIFTFLEENPGAPPKLYL